MKLTPEQLQEIEARKEAANRMVSALCQREREWILSVPARPDYDPDIVISSSLCDIPALLDHIREQETQIAELREAIQRMADWDEGGEIRETFPDVFRLARTELKTEEK